jgi:predicted nucleotidyltransferase
MRPIQYLPTIIDRLVNYFHPGKIVLFGSCARSSTGEGNDLDILVVFKEIIGKKREKTTQIMATVSDLPVGVDCIVATDNEVKSETQKRYSIISAAMREGRVVYESR